MARSDGLSAARDFLFQPGDAAFQLMRGKGGEVFTQDDIGQFLARLQVVRVHGLFAFAAQSPFTGAAFQD